MAAVLYLSFLLPVLFPVIAGAESFENRFQTTADYAVEIIKNFSAKTSGVFDVWFQTLEGAPSKGTLIDYIIPRLDGIARVITSAKCPSGTVKPRLWIVYLHNFHFDAAKLFKEIAYNKLKSYTCILVFYDPMPEHPQLILYNMFIYAGFLNVAFVKMRPYRTSFYFTIDELTVTKEGLYPLEELFHDQTKDFHGHKFLISYRAGSGTKNRMSIASSAMWQWVSAMLSETNATYRLDEVDCDYTRDGEDECFDMLRVSDRNEWYDISLEPIYAKQMRYMDMGYHASSIPHRMMVVVPRGRKLEIMEVFTEPFTSGVWIAFLLLLLGSLAVMWTFPSLFKNDLILLPLCGYENTDLNQTSNVEKLVVSGLVVLYFFLLSAYETKIVALMTSYPRVRDARNVEDMIRDGIRVRLDLNATFPTISKDNDLYRVIDHVPGFSNRKNFTFDGIHAYFGNEVDLRIMMAYPTNYDFEADHPRYVELKDYQFGNAIIFLMTKYRGIIEKRVIVTERSCAETGLLQFWEKQAFRKTLGVNYGLRVTKDQDNQSKNLHLAELAPAWIVLAAGWGIGMMIFLSEVLSSVDRREVKLYVRNKIRISKERRRKQRVNREL